MTLAEMEANSSVVREIREHINRRGLPPVLEPDVEVPVLPHDITQMSTPALMENMSIFDALKTHAQYLASVADTLNNTRQAKYKLSRAKKYITTKEAAEYNGHKMSIPELNATLDADEELTRLRHEEILAAGYQKMVKAMEDGFESKAKLLSRELTRRTVGEV